MSGVMDMVEREDVVRRSAHGAHEASQAGWRSHLGVGRVGPPRTTETFCVRIITLSTGGGDGG